MKNLFHKPGAYRLASLKYSHEGWLLASLKRFPVLELRTSTTGYALASASFRSEDSMYADHTCLAGWSRGPKNPMQCLWSALHESSQEEMRFRSQAWRELLRLMHTALCALSFWLSSSLPTKPENTQQLDFCTAGGGSSWRQDIKEKQEQLIRQNSHPSSHVHPFLGDILLRSKFLYHGSWRGLFKLFRDLPVNLKVMHARCQAASQYLEARWAPLWQSFALKLPKVLIQDVKTCTDLFYKLTYG